MPEVFTNYLNTNLGLMRICASDHFVVSIDFVKSKNKVKSNKICEQASKELQEYFDKKRQVFSVPILLVGTAWQTLVWQKLAQVPYGSIVSYQDLAAAVGKPLSARAVGQAVNKNPIAIMIPCHRVVGSNGALVGYAGGLDKKEYLLNLENKK